MSASPLHACKRGGSDEVFSGPGASGFHDGRVRIDVVPDGDEICASPRRLWLRTGALACLLAVGVASVSLPRGVANWDNVVKIQLARSLLRGEGLVLSGITPDDAQYVQVGKDGRRYSGYLPVAAMLHILTIQVALLTGIEAEGVPALFLLGLVAWTLVAWGKRSGVSPCAAAAGAVLACFGTALWPMAALGYDVVIEALALSLVLRAGANEGERLEPWLLAGAAIGLAFATRLGAALLVVPAAVAALAAPRRRVSTVLRQGSALAAGAAPGALLVFCYNFQRFGSPFVVFQPTALGRVEDLGAPWFSVLHLQGIAGLLLSPGKGLFWYAPPMLLVAAWAPVLVRRHRAAALTLGAYALATLVVFGRFRYWHGDWAWGPRYMAPLFIAVAPVAWLLAERVRETSPRGKAAAVALLVVAGILQMAPVVGKPVPYHFALTLSPLEAQGRLATHPLTRPPGPEDYVILYFAPQHSMIVSLARGLARAAEKPRFWERVLRALATPVCAGAFVAWTARARWERVSAERTA